MNNHVTLISALSIFHKYEPGNQDHITADHDILYAGDDDVYEAMTAEDKAALEVLGWEWNEDGPFWTLSV